MSSDEFRLEQVLDHARRQEERKQIELKTLTEEERCLREQLIGLREKEEAQVRSLSQHSRRGHRAGRYRHRARLPERD